MSVQQEIQFLLKLLGFSLLISLGIKFVAPLLPLPATSMNALLLVFLPPLGLGAYLLLRNPLGGDNQ
jgi:hypothetical protein